MSAGEPGPAPFALPVTELTLQPAELDPAQIRAGSPSVAERALWTAGDVEAGVWEITPGVSTDVETDELFVVIAGRATVEIEDGPTLELAPGVVGSFPAGTRTVWTVHETVRKVYVVG